MSQYKKRSGPRSIQAAISADYAAAGLPPKPPGAVCYQQFPPGTMVSRRGDLAFTDRRMGFVTTSSGPVDTSIFASWANRPKPKRDDLDAYCSNFTMVGIVKNDTTDPVSGLTAQNGGVTRINQQKIAVQLTGSTTIPCNSQQSIQVGDPVMWSPPHEHTDNGIVPVGRVEPLNWQCCTSIVKHMLISMLWHYREKVSISVTEHVGPNACKANSCYTLGTWGTASREKARFFLTIAMAALIIFSRKGYIKIMSPTVSKKEALKDKLIHDISAGLKNKTLNEDDVLALIRTYDGIVEDLSNGHDVADYDNKNRHTAFYHDPTSKDLGEDDTIGIYTFDREEDLLVVSSKMMQDTRSHDVKKSKETQNALNWMIQNLGLAGGSQGFGGSQDMTAYTNYEFLRFASYGALTDDEKIDVKSAIMFPEDYVNLEGNPIKDAYLIHLTNSVTGEAISSQQLRDSVMHRVFGTAISSHKGVTGNNSGDATLDVDVGIRSL